VCHSTTRFLSHLVNQAVPIVLPILVLLLECPTDDSIEIAVGLTQEVGAFLTENLPKSNKIILGRFRDEPNNSGRFGSSRGRGANHAPHSPRGRVAGSRGIEYVLSPAFIIYRLILCIDIFKFDPKKSTKLS
jgi:hypothetical protein